MAESELLKMYKALDEPELGQRIQGAMVKYAHYLTGQPGSDPVALAFANLVLESPTAPWQEMKIQVVTNSTVLADIKMDRVGNTDSYYVLDSDISYVVESTWLIVAAMVLPEPAP